MNENTTRSGDTINDPRIGVLYGTGNWIAMGDRFWRKNQVLYPSNNNGTW